MTPTIPSNPLAERGPTKEAMLAAEKIWRRDGETVLSLAQRIDAATGLPELLLLRKALENILACYTPYGTSIQIENDLTMAREIARAALAATAKPPTPAEQP